MKSGLELRRGGRAYKRPGTATILSIAIGCRLQGLIEKSISQGQKKIRHPGRICAGDLADEVRSCPIEQCPASFKHKTLTSFNIDLYDIRDRKSFG